jgi:hypothetical protein
MTTTRDPWPPNGKEPTISAMNTAKKIYESDEQGIVHVDVPVGRSRRRVEVLLVREEVTDDGEGACAMGTAKVHGGPRST